MSTKTRQVKLLYAIMILCFLLLCLSLVSQVFAMYISKVNSSSSAVVACFNPSYTSDKITISGINQPGSSDTCNLKIQNYTDEIISEVAMGYKIKINTTGNLPLVFTLRDKEGNVLSTWDCDGISGETQYLFESPNTFLASVASSVEYTIEVKWLEERNDAKFSGMTDVIYISVEWEQID